MKTQIEVFKTTVNTKKMAHQISNEISNLAPECSIHFDLDDCDKILRIEAREINSEEIIRIVSSFGNQCAILE